MEKVLKATVASAKIWWNFTETVNEMLNTEFESFKNFYKYFNKIFE